METVTTAILDICLDRIGEWKQLDGFRKKRR